MKEKWCCYHQKMEPISEFQENSFQKDGKQNVCSRAQNSYSNDYYYAHKDALNKKAVVYMAFKRGNISEEQKNCQVRSINKRYGIASRI